MRDTPLIAPEGVRFPFESRKVDFATWTYIHRAGVYMIVIAILLFGIAFVSFRIHLVRSIPYQDVMLDFQAGITPEEYERDEMERTGKLSEGGRYDYSGVSNRLSNENAALNSDIRDAQNTNASELYEEARKLTEQMNANRMEYEAGLRSEQAILGGGGGSGQGYGAGGARGGGSGTGQASASDAGAGGGGRGADTRVKGGRVTVSFSFMNPVRTSVRVVVPAYLCEGGGEVVVKVTLNRNGDVTSASIDRSLSSSDECMRSAAEKAARESRFNVDNSAPAKHSGTITYIFIPQ